MNCPACGDPDVLYHRLLGGDLEAVCASCGEHLHYVVVPW